MNQDPLAGLRAYHLPEPVSWWPPAPGWWILAGLVLVLAAALRFRRRRGRRLRQASHLAGRELAALRAVWHADGDDLALLRGLSQLARRFILARFPTDAAAGLTGEAWLAYLAEKSGNPAFVEGAGRRLADAPYRADCGADRGADASAIAELVEQLIARNVGGAAPERSA